MPMTINTSWLLEYLEPKCSHEELLEALPKVGLEIEERHDLRSELEAVRVGFVRGKQLHPDADGMYVCQIEMKRGEVVSVVCASEHEVRVGWGVPVATAGTMLPTGREIKEGSFHGVRSVGMVCLDGEMGMLAEGSGMHHVTDETYLGASLPEAVPVSGYLVTVNVLPNRSDFLGLIGIAREVAALYRLKLRYPQTLSKSPTGGPAPVEVEISEPDLCPRYMCGAIRGVRVGPSSPWLKARLLLAGMRPISNVVDVTNYVMYEYGQPLHAFDLARIRGRRIVVRRMAADEWLELLTGKTIAANAPGKPPLVIADAERPLALAGIMGGSESQTTALTTDVLVEAAHFERVNIRHTVGQVDLGKDGRGTDSSYRFERGTDPNLMLEGALGRALHLITEMAGGAVVGPIVDRYPQPIKPRTFRLDPARISSYLGMPVDEATARDCLERLEMRCGKEMEVQVPTWRSDADDPVVLIEDVARMLGYDQVPVVPQHGGLTLGLRAAPDRLRQAVTEYLVSAGFYECRSPSLESPEMTPWLGPAPAPTVIRNAKSAEMSVLRRSLLPGLARAADKNIRYGADSVRLFEVDRTFAPVAAADPPSSGDSLSGRWRVGGITGGPVDRSNWRAGGQKVDFFVAKGWVEDLLGAVRCQPYAMRRADAAPYLPGRTAEVLVGEGGDRVAGWMGELDPAAFRIDRLPFPLFGFELEMEALQQGSAAIYLAIPRLPPVTRDLAFVVPMTVAFGDVLAVIRQVAGPTLTSLQLVDRYQGSQVPAGHQSLAFHLVFRDPQRTLRAEEVAQTTDQIVTSLRERFGAQLRA